MSSTVTTVLFLGSRPAETAGLDVFNELSKIDQHLRQTDLRDRFVLVPKWGVTASGLPGAIMQIRPTVIHFSGHGNESGELIFHGPDGTPFSEPTDTIASIFGILNDIVRCVVLNACYSRVQAELIAEYVDAVVGMDNQISDDAAIAFASGFYEALGYDRSIADAVDLGRIQMKRFGALAEHGPRLHVKSGVQAASLRLSASRGAASGQNASAVSTTATDAEPDSDFDEVEMEAHRLLSQPVPPQRTPLERHLRDQIQVCLDIIILRQTRMREIEREIGLGGLGVIAADYRLRIVDERNKIRAERARIRKCLDQLYALQRKPGR